MRNGGCKVGLVDANVNASTAGKKLASKQENKSGGDDFTGKMKSLFASSWLPQVESDSDLKPVVDSAPEAAPEVPQEKVCGIPDLAKQKEISEQCKKSGTCPGPTSI